MIRSRHSPVTSAARGPRRLRLLLFRRRPALPGQAEMAVAEDNAALARATVLPCAGSICVRPTFLTMKACRITCLRHDWLRLRIGGPLDQGESPPGRPTPIAT